VIETEQSPPYRVFEDSSLYGILIGNALAFLSAVTRHWSIAPLLWIYWGQSVAIGVSNVIRMLRLREFSTEGFQLGGRPVPATRDSLEQSALFFSFHYGFFHLVYALFLAAGAVGGRLAEAEVPWVLGNIATFAIAHGYSLLINHGRDFRQKKPNLGTLVFYPYLRILPMHLAIILGSTMIGVAVPVFIGLKTLADAGLHAVERRLFRGE